MAFSSLASLVLKQGVRYALVQGYVAFFAVFTSFLVWLKKWLEGSLSKSEWFSSAGRSIKTGLLASVIVSQWMWAATILQSSPFAWKSGARGLLWYLTGAAIQVLLFGVMAMVIAELAPKAADTVRENAKERQRSGGQADVVSLIFCYTANMIVTAMLQLGGSALINALTSLNIYSASILIPLGVTLYLSIHPAFKLFIWWQKKTFDSSRRGTFIFVEYTIVTAFTIALGTFVHAACIILPIIICTETIHSVLKAERSR
ncbi:urea-proton symporter DUR3-like [Typha angustifolia]|uniref:urea-proton symporter DUR3-like n=1 Tax=Typha angustifolia TaxID=59011 RepID=UPI003C305BB0